MVVPYWPSHLFFSLKPFYFSLFSLLLGPLERKGNGTNGHISRALYHMDIAVSDAADFFSFFFVVLGKARVLGNVMKAASLNRYPYLYQSAKHLNTIEMINETEI